MAERRAEIAPRNAGRLGRLRATVRHLFSPASGLIGQLVRYGLTGGVVTLVYLTITTVLSQVVGLPFEVALAIGFACALLLHFNLQRLFVWLHHSEFALPIQHQVGRYLAMAGTQYGLTALSTATLPAPTGLPTEVIYVMTLSVVTTAGFLLMRFVIFHPLAGDGAVAESPRAGAGPRSGRAARGLPGGKRT